MTCYGHVYLTLFKFPYQYLLSEQCKINKNKTLEGEVKIILYAKLLLLNNMFCIYECYKLPVCLDKYNSNFQCFKLFYDIFYSVFSYVV